MRRSLLLFLSALAVLGGCASSQDSRWFDGAFMSFEVVEVGPRQYKVFAKGAGAHTPEEVERGFLVRADELCLGKEFSHELQTTPYQYGSSGGGFSFTHDAFKTVGIVQCK